MSVSKVTSKPTEILTTTSAVGAKDTVGSILGQGEGTGVVGTGDGTEVGPGVVGREVGTAVGIPLG